MDNFVVSDGLIERDSERAWLLSAFESAVTGHGLWSCCRAKPGSVRAVWSRPWPSRPMPISCAAQAGPPRPPMRRSSQPCAASCGPTRGGCQAAVPCVLISRCCSRARRRRERERPRDIVRGDPLRAGRCGVGGTGDPAARRPAGSDETTLELLGDARRAAERSRSSRLRPIARMRFRVCTASAGCATSCVARLPSRVDPGAADRDRNAELAARVLGERPSADLTRTLHDRANGIPFFVEALAAALDASDGLQRGDDGLDLALDARCKCRRRSATPCFCS